MLFGRLPSILCYTVICLGFFIYFKNTNMVLVFTEIIRLLLRTKTCHTFIFKECYCEFNTVKQLFNKKINRRDDFIFVCLLFFCLFFYCFLFYSFV